MREGPSSLQGGVQRQKFPDDFHRLGSDIKWGKKKGRSWALHYGPGCSKLFCRLTSWEITSNHFCPSKSQLEPLPQVTGITLFRQLLPLVPAIPAACSHPSLALMRKLLWSFPSATFSQPPLGKFHHQFFILLRRQLNPRRKNCSLFKIRQDEPAHTSLSSK